MSYLIPKYSAVVILGVKMEEYNFKIDGCIKSCYYNENNKIAFCPAVYEQRYSAVISILENESFEGKIKKV